MKIKIEVEVDREAIETIIEMAGMSIAYWAQAAHWDQKGRMYRVTVNEDDHDETMGERVQILYYWQLGAALAQLIEERGTEITGENLIDKGKVDAGAIDSDLADMIVQTAMFGKLVFG